MNRVKIATKAVAIFFMERNTIIAGYGAHLGKEPAGFSREHVKADVLRSIFPLLLTINISKKLPVSVLVFKNVCSFIIRLMKTGMVK